MALPYKFKRVLIIGGSEGIGFALAEKFVQGGAHVTIVSRSPIKLQEAEQRLRSSVNNQAQELRSKALDVTNFEKVQKWANEDYQHYGDVPDYLINCAGFAHPGYAHQVPVEKEKSMMDLNHFGGVHLVKAFLPYFLKAKKGHIVLTSSIAGYVGLFGYTGYCASKFAVLGYAEALRREVGPCGVTVSVLCPPNTLTPGLKRENQIKPAEVLALEEKAKPLTADQVASVALREFQKKPFMIIPGLDGKVAFKLNRYLPQILEVLVKRPTSTLQEFQ